jgi:hypothetical protein
LLPGGGKEPPARAAPLIALKARGRGAADACEVPGAPNAGKRTAQADHVYGASLPPRRRIPPGMPADRGAVATSTEAAGTWRDGRHRRCPHPCACPARPTPCDHARPAARRTPFRSGGRAANPPAIRPPVPRPHIADRSSWGAHPRLRTRDIRFRGLDCRCMRQRRLPRDGPSPDGAFGGLAGCGTPQTAEPILPARAAPDVEPGGQTARAQPLPALPFHLRREIPPSPDGPSLRCPSPHYCRKRAFARETWRSQGPARSDTACVIPAVRAHSARARPGDRGAPDDASCRGAAVPLRSPGREERRSRRGGGVEAPCRTAPRDRGAGIAGRRLTGREPTARAGSPLGCAPTGRAASVR